MSKPTFYITFSFTATNVVTAEWTVSLTNKEGKDFKIDVVTVIDARNFKLFEFATIYPIHQP